MIRPGTVDGRNHLLQQDLPAIENFRPAGRDTFRRRAIEVQDDRLFQVTIMPGHHRQADQRWAATVPRVHPGERRGIDDAQPGGK